MTCNSQMTTTMTTTTRPRRDREREPSLNREPRAGSPAIARADPDPPLAGAHGIDVTSTEGSASA
jgi:hypothetical protein